MTSKKGGITAAEIIKKFVGVVNSSEIFKKQTELLKLISSSLKVCREKLQSLETDEALEVLSKIEVGYQTQLITNVEEIFYEEVENGKCILKDIDCILSELNTLLESINQRLEDEYVKNFEPKSSSLVLICYEDCRSILTFLKLKSSILRSYLAIPFHEKVDSNPFANCPKFTTDEDNCIYMLSKLEVANI